MKTTKKALREAVDSFLYRYDWLTGGTSKEAAAPRAPRHFINHRGSYYGERRGMGFGGSRKRTRGGKRGSTGGR